MGLLATSPTIIYSFSPGQVQSSSFSHSWVTLAFAGQGECSHQSCAPESVLDCQPDLCFVFNSLFISYRPDSPSVAVPSCSSFFTQIFCCSSTRPCSYCCVSLCSPSVRRNVYKAVSIFCLRLISCWWKSVSFSSHRIKRLEFF
jgi:hypothetical protein